MEASLLEHVRFGYGPKAGERVAPGGVDPDRLLAQLSAPDPAREAPSRPGMADRMGLAADHRAERMKNRAEGTRTDEAFKQFRLMIAGDNKAILVEATQTVTPFRERLVNFWANRLTINAGFPKVGYFAGAYRQDVMRPHLTGRFADMLHASLWHPAMLRYLDQVRSVGPNSPFGKKRGQGLNENYARELLELHSMGSGYTQDDVTEVARLLAGLNVRPEGAVLDKARAEPGQKVILGTRYGEGPEEIARFVEDLAMRPETAQSVAHALARHFLSETPPEPLVAAMAQTYLAGGGQLVPVYRRMLEHPAASDPVLHKIRTPFDFVAASLRAFGLSGREGPKDGAPKAGLKPEAAMQAMGQTVMRPRGPDGWAEEPEEWITPPYLAARLLWAERIARFRAERSDPVELTRHVLGDLASADTRLAVAQAEQWWEGAAVLLGSPDFMRR